MFCQSCPTRLNVAVMLFMSAFTCYVLRVNMSINILGMVQPTTAENKTLEPPPDYGPRYDWSKGEQSLLLGSYFYGYILTQLPSGVLSDMVGGRIVIGYALALSAVATAFIPLIAQACSFWCVFLMRVLTGMLGGFIFPGMQNIISKWAPPTEKGKFVFTVLGGTLGTVFTWPVAGWLMERFGWVYAFYVPAIFTFFVTALWFLVVYNTPAEHPRISHKEQTYIEESLGENVSNKKRGLPPLKCLLTSMPFWALLFLHWGNLWSFYFLITGAPKYMSEILEFNLSNAGIWASLPYLVRFFTGFMFSALGDSLTKNKTMEVTTIRKFFCIFSHIIPGLLLFGLSRVGNHPMWCVGLITIAMAFNGSSTITNLQNPQDLAPNYTAIIFAIINFFGTSSGFLAPLMVTYFTRHRNTVDEWSIIFFVSSVLYIVPAIFFMVFGSAKVQYWNDDSYKLQADQNGKGSQVEESKF